MISAWAGCSLTCFFLSFCFIINPQTIGISRTSPGESPASLELSRTGDVWVQLGDTSWLLDLQDDVSMATKVENTLHLEVVVPESASVVKVSLRCGGDGGEGGRMVEVVWEGPGVEELSGQVQLEENRGKPLKVINLTKTQFIKDTLELT